MWSTCSIETGHSWTHAPQVTQSHTISSGTPLPTIGDSSPPASATAPSAKSWSRTPMIRSFGESVFPVAQAGQTSWQRPHSVHENASTICFHVRSRDVPDAEAHLLVGHVIVEAQRLEPPALPSSARSRR